MNSLMMTHCSFSVFSKNVSYEYSERSFQWNSSLFNSTCPFILEFFYKTATLLRARGFSCAVLSLVWASLFMNCAKSDQVYFLLVVLWMLFCAIIIISLRVLPLQNAKNRWWWKYVFACVSSPKCKSKSLRLYSPLVYIRMIQDLVCYCQSVVM